MFGETLNYNLDSYKSQKYFKNKMFNISLSSYLKNNLRQSNSCSHYIILPKYY